MIEKGYYQLDEIMKRECDINMILRELAHKLMINEDMGKNDINSEELYTHFINSKDLYTLLQNMSDSEIVKQLAKDYDGMTILELVNN